MGNSETNVKASSGRVIFVAGIEEMVEIFYKKEVSSGIVEDYIKILHE